MVCLDFGSTVGEFRIATFIETHGLDCGPFERLDQEFILCRNCGGKFDLSDWDDTPELSLTRGQAPSVSAGYRDEHMERSDGACVKVPPLAYRRPQESDYVT